MTVNAARTMRVAAMDLYVTDSRGAFLRWKNENPAVLQGDATYLNRKSNKCYGSPVS